MTKVPKSSDPDQPWTIEADMIGTILKITNKQAIDLVIVRYLKFGDTRPLVGKRHVLDLLQSAAVAGARPAHEPRDPRRA